MENKVRFKLHKVKKNWVTIGVTTLSMVALAGGSLLAQGKVEADETSAPNGDGLQQLSEDGTASLVTTTTVTEQASAQASVLAVETVRNKLTGDDKCGRSRGNCSSTKQSSYRSRSGSFFANSS